MPLGRGRFITSAKVQKVFGRSKSGGGSELGRRWGLLTYVFFTKHRAGGRDALCFFMLFYNCGWGFKPKTMKNTAGRVGPTAGGLGGRGSLRTPREGAAPEGRARPGLTSRPRRETKNVCNWRALGAGHGPANSSAGSAKGKQAMPRTAAPGGSRQKRGAKRQPLCRAKREPPQGACPLARRSLPAQEPDKGSGATAPNSPRDQQATAPRRTGDERRAGSAAGVLKSKGLLRAPAHREDRSGAAKPRPEEWRGGSRVPPPDDGRICPPGWRGGQAAGQGVGGGAAASPHAGGLLVFFHHWHRSPRTCAPVRAHWARVCAAHRLCNRGRRWHHWLVFYGIACRIY